MQAENTELKALLDAAGINQADLSRKLGISATSISKWNKSGVPQYAKSYLELLAKYNRIVSKL